jgi:hypothetical protein
VISLFHDPLRMPRPLTFRLSTLGATLAFAATGGVTGMEAHPLSAHGPHADDLIAMELGAPAHHAEGADEKPVATHSGLSEHSGHPEHDSSGECTCVGPCQGGAPPDLAESETVEVAAGATAYTRPTAPLARLIPQDPRSYLLPLPNAPPARV